MSDPIETEPTDLAPPRAARQGFLPIHTNTFDRVFIAVIVFVAINLLWMRFLEASIPLTVGTVLSVILGAFIVARG